VIARNLRAVVVVVDLDGDGDVNVVPTVDS